MLWTIIGTALCAALIGYLIGRLVGRNTIILELIDSKDPEAWNQAHYLRIDAKVRRLPPKPERIEKVRP